MWPFFSVEDLLVARGKPKGEGWRRGYCSACHDEGRLGKPRWITFNGKLNVCKHHINVTERKRKEQTDE